MVDRTDKDAVAHQYEKWVYPFPIADLGAPEIGRRRDGGDYERNWHTLWPDRPYRDDLDILIAGCGSNAAARYAFNHPQARVTGIDLSAASLAHEERLKAKHRLDNLTLCQARIEDVASLGRDFDFIDASGVLHHLPDPVSGLRALAGVLRPEGTIVIMVYGQYGRSGVYMLQEMFRLLGLQQTETDLSTLKRTLAALPKQHVIQEYLSRTQDLKYDAGLVDTFLHRQDRAYTVAQCLEFARAGGTNFMHWLDNILYYPEGQLNPTHELYQRVNAMPEPAIWQLMELYNGTLGQHLFCVCHPARAPASYRIDFGSNGFMDYVPIRRCEEVKRDDTAPADSIVIKRPQRPQYTLTPTASALFRQIDGHRSIRQCFAASGLTSSAPDDLCRTVFRYLWRLSHIFLRMPY